MKNICLISLILFICTLPLLADETSVPAITEITPPRAQVDEKVTIKGSNFHPDKRKNIVHFGQVLAEVLEATPGSLVVKVPGGAKVCNVYVEVMGARSREVRFYVLPYLEFMLAEKNMTPGQKTRGIIKIHGSKKPWKIKVTNKYYEVIDLPAGNEQVVISSGGDDNRAEIEIYAKKMGNFSLICKKIEEMDESPQVSSKGTPVPEKSPAAVRTPESTPTPEKTAAVKTPEPTPTPEKTAAIKTPEPTPTPEKTAAVKTPEPTATPEKTAAIKIPKASPTPEKTAEAVRTPEPSPAPEHSPAADTGGARKNPSGAALPKTTDRNKVLAYCNKLKDRVNTLKNELLKIQKQLEDRKESYGVMKGREDARKQGRIKSIDERGIKVARRLGEIPGEITALKKDDEEKNKTKIENLKKEEEKLLTEQRNIKIWKKSVASGYSKDTLSARKSIKTLTARRDSLQKEIRKLQDEYDKKLKSLVSPS